jgi:ABC-type phosphate/phosphonate transport system substrate-binding protein
MSWCFNQTDTTNDFTGYCSCFGVQKKEPLVRAEALKRDFFAFQVVKKLIK